MRDTKLLETFRALVRRAEKLQAKAERLCEKANKNGTENEEFEVRAEADFFRAEALAVAVQLLDTSGPVIRVLDLSTAHLPQRVCRDLNGYDGVTARDLEYGWLLWVPEDLKRHLENYGKTSIPKSVRRIWKYADGLGCTYVLLDRDAKKVAGLRTWDW